MAFLCQLVNGVAVNNFPLEKEIINIGRAAENDLHIEEQSVSSKHAVIEITGKDNAYQIRDLESTNSTYVNGKTVSCQVLKNNDLIRIGIVDFKFVEKSQDLTDTVKIKKSWIPGVYFTS